MALDFRVLGPLEVWRDGEPLRVTAPKQRRLLSLLLLSANEPVTQDELMDALWGDEPPPTARASFQNQIHALRRLLGRETIEGTPGGYALRVAASAVDLERFRRLAAEARRAPLVERAATLRQALALWRGPAFPELVGDARPLAALTRLEEERLGALEDRVEAELELGKHAALVPELQAAVSCHPLRERMWAQLMLALYRSGRQADALAAYGRAHATFMEELGLEPGVVLKELQRAILRQDRALGDAKRTVGSTLERAAALLPRAPRERVESLIEYGTALIQMAELRQAATALEGASRLAKSSGERSAEERVRILLSYLTVFAEGAPLLEHLAVAERADRVFEELGDDAGRAFALSHQAHILRETGRCELALELSLRGAKFAARSGDRVSEASCWRMAMQCAALGPTPVDEALAICRETEETIGELFPDSAWEARAWLLAQAGRIHEARDVYERGLAALELGGLLLKFTVGLALAARAERAAGDCQRAATLLRRSYDLCRAEEARGDLGPAAGELASVLALTGDHSDARRFANESRTLIAHGDLLSEALWRRALALAVASEGRQEEALRLSEEARAYVDGTDWLTIRGETLEDVASVRACAGDVAGASEALRAALGLYERKGNLAGGRRVRAVLSEWN